MDTEINEQESLSIDEIIERYAQIQKISIEQAKEEIGADTTEKILKNIEQKTLDKIHEKMPVMNRAQRRAMKKKVGAKKYAEMMAQNNDPTAVITEAAKKLNYIDLIQKLRKLNKEKEENGETIIENDGSVDC